MKIPEFEVSFGKKKKHPLHLYILGAVLGFIIDMLHRLLHVSPKDLWALVDQIGREFDIEDIQQLILASPTLLNDRIGETLMMLSKTLNLKILRSNQYSLRRKKEKRR